MEVFLNLLFSGLATGSIYAIVAIGFTLLWQTSQTINFAQGEFAMLPVFIMLVALNLGADLWLAILSGIIFSAVVLGVIFKKIVVNPMIRHGVLPLAIATMALSILLKESAKEFYSAEAYKFPSLFPDEFVDVMGIPIQIQSLGLLAVTILIVIALHIFINQTLVGRKMQAVAQNIDLAQILGINTERMILYSFVINAILVAVASLLISPIYLVKFTNGEVIGLYAFIAAVVGGFNRTQGALIGGLLLGVLDNFSALYISTQYRIALPLMALIIVVVFLPNGIGGKSAGRAI